MAPSLSGNCRPAPQAPARWLTTLLGLVAVALFWPDGPPALAAILGTTQVAEVSTPTVAAFAPGDAGRLFIAQIDGTVRILDLASGNLLPAPFLAIPDVSTASEGGLLGLAFHPDFATNGKFFALVTTTGTETTRIREYTVSANPNVANPAPRQIASWTKTTLEHNGGWIGFNPAASPTEKPYLYVTTGDDETPSNAQAQDNWNGKVLRFNVDGDAFPASVEQNYAIPATNPFAGGSPADDPVWALGLRNPWRASFDRATGDLWIADVGQERIEEVNRRLAAAPGGDNYGWSAREGSENYLGGPTLPNERTPLYDYFHRGVDCTVDALCGNSVIGGFVYRGNDPDLYGKYLFADFITSNYWSFDPAAPDATVQRINGALFGAGPQAILPIAFGEDARGNLYILTGAGKVLRIDTGGDFDRNGAVDGNDLLLWQRGQSPSSMSAGDLASWLERFPAATQAADFDENGAVNAADLVLWRAGFGALVAAAHMQGNANSDGAVDGADLLLWQKQLGHYAAGAVSSPTTPAVPEPTALALALYGLSARTILALLRRRKYE